MAVPIDPTRGALPPVAQFLAEAALQRQSSLLGLDKPRTAPAAAAHSADPSAPQPTATSPSPAAEPLIAPAPSPADKDSISPRAREPLGAGFEPRGSGVNQGATGPAAGALNPALPPGAQPGRAPALALLPSPLAALPMRAQAPTASGAGAAVPAAATWPAAGLPAPLQHLVGAAVHQLTQASGSPQRVVAAQPWPIGLAHALESGDADPAQPPLQTWMVGQGAVQTPEGLRGFALTLRAPVPWVAAQPMAAAAAGAPAAAAPSLQLPFAGKAQALQSGVFALVLQGPDSRASARTSALLVLDLQAAAPATVYGREMLVPQALRLDPWAQMAVLQASGQVPREDDRARNGASGLCETTGCPYVARAACVQPFCMAMRAVPPPEPVGPPAAPGGG